MSGPFEHDTREWLEADGRGGFASGTVNGVRTRRYHALLLTATTPPTGRMVLVNGFDAWLETEAGRVSLTTQAYAPDTRYPDGASRIARFDHEPWPAWELSCENGARVRQEIVVPHDRDAVILTWRLLEGPASGARLVVRPFLSGRDYHATHHENASLRSEARSGEGLVRWHPYDDVPAVVSRTNARYAHQPDWYRQFVYSAEQARGLDDREDLWSPGFLTWDLVPGGADAVWLLEAEAPGAASGAPTGSVARPDVFTLVADLCARERARRAGFPSPLARAADAYLVRRGAGQTIVAGYPWFTDWGRDTFIALRGLCLATGRFDDARAILLEWAGVVADGLLPNRFPDGGAAPEYNSIDAALWYAAGVQAFCEAADRGTTTLTADERARVSDAVTSILTGLARGTRYGIHVDRDGLLACGEPGVQLTWMDAKIGDWVVTPRTGKPVEVQALWLNALAFAAAEARRTGTDDRWARLFQQGRAAFEARFWNEETGCLYDVIDVDHRPGQVDGAIRPNQILAVGGLPVQLLTPARSRAVVDVVERELVTPLGLRSLGPREPGYRPHYGGGPLERDSAYHQGTVWPWLMGPFVDAWLRVHGDEPDAVRRARDRFLAPLVAHLDTAGLGHVSEVADAEPPHLPGGCPFQAWSVGELLRIDATLREHTRAPDVTGVLIARSGP